MTNRATSLVLGTLTCVIASASILTMHLGDAGAADDCLAAPKKETPAGQHWFFKFDRGASRRCWYLGDADKAVARAAKSRPARSVASPQESRSENPSTRSPADALAEWPQAAVANTLRAEDTTLAAPTDAPRAVEADDSAQPSPAPAPADVPQSPVASRWPEPAGVSSSAIEPPRAPVAVASATPDAASNMATTADPAPGAVPPPMSQPDVAAARPADTPKPVLTAKPADSVYALMLAFGGALILVGVTGLSTYLMTDARRQARRQAWAPERRVDPARLPSWLEPAANDSHRLLGPAHWADAQGATRPASRLADEVSEIERLLAHQARS
jgi:hypothetical protein